MIDGQLGLTARLAGCLPDWRQVGKVEHDLLTMSAAAALASPAAPSAKGLGRCSEERGAGETGREGDKARWRNGEPGKRGIKSGVRNAE